MADCLEKHDSLSQSRTKVMPVAALNSTAQPRVQQQRIELCPPKVCKQKPQPPAGSLSKCSSLLTAASTCRIRTWTFGHGHSFALCFLGRGTHHKKRKSEKKCNPLANGRNGWKIKVNAVRGQWPSQSGFGSNNDIASAFCNFLLLSGAWQFPAAIEPDSSWMDWHKENCFAWCENMVMLGLAFPRTTRH